MSPEHHTLTRVTDDWYIACPAKELGRGLNAFTLMGTPVVLFRGEDGTPGALLDRCPHRNAPLSLGRVYGDRIECRYHGWSFDRDGRCRDVPGLMGTAERAGREVDSFPCREEDGFVWIYATPGVAPGREPFRFPYLKEARYTTVRQTFDVEATLHAVAENALDVPHTAFLHRGLFRGNRAPCQIEVAVRRWHDRVEAQYIGEPRPAGVVGRLLAPRGGVVTHFDRFILPSIAQVEYRLGENSHLCISTALTPIEDFKTRMFSVLTFRLPIPGWLLTAGLKLIALRILKQDAWILRHQTQVIRRFGGEHYVSTEIDALGPHISLLLRDAERGHREESPEPATRSFRMKI